MSYRPGQPAVEIYRHRESAGVGDLSHDGSLIAIEHTEHGDAMHSAIRVVRADGSTVAELDDTNGGTEELGLSVMGFAPVDGDARLLVGHQRRGRWEPMIWDPVTGDGDAPGDRPARRCGRRLVSGRLGAAGGARVPRPQRAVALRAGCAGPRRRAAAAEGRALTRVETPAGTVSGATARPDGTVEFLWSSAAQPPEVRSTSGKVVLDPPGMKAPGSVPVTDAWVEGPGGRIHALVQKPEGAGPFPHGLRHPRRPDLARQRRVRLVAGRLGGPRLRRRPRQLPRLDRLRPRLDGRAQAPRRADRAGGHRRGPRVGGGLRAGRPGAAGAGGRLVGRLSDAAGARHAAGGVGGGPGGGARSRTTSRPTTTRWKP